MPIPSIERTSTAGSNWGVPPKELPCRLNLMTAYYQGFLPLRDHFPGSDPSSADVRAHGVNPNHANGSAYMP